MLPGVDVGHARAVTPHARANMRRRKVEAPLPNPWDAVLIAVDTAATSGWAVSVSGKRLDSGEVDTLDADRLESIVRWAVSLGAEHKQPVVIVLEKPWGGNVTIVSALGAARERWMRAWRGADQSRGRVVLVSPGTWRSAVLGGYWVSARRDNVRVHEQLVARAVKGAPVGPDEAAAILIARWAAHASAIGKVIGKRAIKASLRAWAK